mmetsp:Transcript_29213/g.74254  ORF Transcript_29213/g.74254 Transcript_29213/m.74254 type:complete len:201 (+) Transcript_29213:525-1127(+)
MCLSDVSSSSTAPRAGASSTRRAPACRAPTIAVLLSPSSSTVRLTSWRWTPWSAAVMLSRLTESALRIRHPTLVQAASSLAASLLVAQRPAPAICPPHAAATAWARCARVPVGSHSDRSAPRQCTVRRLHGCRASQTVPVRAIVASPRLKRPKFSSLPPRWYAVWNSLKTAPRKPTLLRASWSIDSKSASMMARSSSLAP